MAFKKKTATVNISKKQPVLLVPQAHRQGRVAELANFFPQEQELVLPQTPVPVHRLRLLTAELLGEAEGGGKVVAGDALVDCDWMGGTVRHAHTKKSQIGTQQHSLARNSDVRFLPHPAAASA